MSDGVLILIYCSTEAFLGPIIGAQLQKRDGVHKTTSTLQLKKTSYYFFSLFNERAWLCRWLGRDDFIDKLVF
jgi:hypothetical protein